ncbi:hypothetical protein DPMN_122340 [Dreissena polymorpha]|uniref:Uncharacterized protein n=1 Tax=Dreissena polymorpha TaxID=45954 RepID=A0A9D4JQB0_DREPO|nr:hypothetical protein DPMN_122340 [Dreissena polymorpha]
MLQFLNSSYSPTQNAPPATGFGLLHVRTLVAVPLPHVIEHSLHGYHEDQPPSTKKRYVEVTV